MAHAQHLPLLVALAHAAPAGLDREAAVERACEWIVDAGRAGAHVLILPAPALPDIAAPGGAADRLGRAAQRARIHVLLLPMPGGGATDGATARSMLYLDAHGGIQAAARPFGAWPVAESESIVYVAVEWPGAAVTPGGRPALPPTSAGGI